MKKLLAVLLALLMASVMLSGCVQDEPEPVHEGPVYKVCNLVNGNLGDKSFFDSAEAGLQQLDADGRIDLKTIEMGATDADQPGWEETILEVAESGEYDVIICGTYQMPEYLKAAADKYPDQKFVIYDDDTHKGESPNVCNIVYRQNDLGYIMGVLGAKMTAVENERLNPEKVIGFIGGIDGPVINDFLIGFLTGAKDTDPEVKVDTRYVGDFINTATAKEIALSMINDKKADIIWGVAGNAGNGGVEAITEAGKGWFFGVDSDQELTLPENQSANTMTSGLKNCGASLIWFFDELDAGRPHYGECVKLGLSEDGVGIVTDKNYATVVPDDVKQAVEDAIAKIVSGDIKVPSAFGDDAADIIAERTAMQP